MNKHKCTLTDLYKSAHIQTIIYEVLSCVFKESFIKIISEARNFKPYLVEAGHYYMDDIREKFIENGEFFENLEDLEKILNDLNAWKHAEFRLGKERYEELYKEERKTVKFDI